MDMSTIKPGVTILDIKTPHGDPTGLKWHIVSTEDPRVKEVTDKLYNFINKKRSRGGWLTPQERDDWSKRILIAATVGWEWGDVKDASGKIIDTATWGDKKTKPEFNGKNVSDVLDAGFIAKQVDEGLGDTERFFSA